MTHPLLSSVRVRLRPLEPNDIMLLYRLENDSRLWDSSNTVQPLSRHALKQFIANAQTDIYAQRQIRLVIDVKPDVFTQSTDNYKPVGVVDLQNFSPRNQRAEVGIALLPQEHHNGYATQALHLLHRYTSEVLSLHQLYAIVATNNNQAQALFTKCGYTKVAHLKEWLKLRTRYVDVDVFQIIF